MNQKNSKKKINHKKKTFLLPLLAFVSLTVVYVFLYKLFIPRVNLFGCFDDCFNFMGGYFMLNGKQLYSEIFFNHQMLMAYLSLLVQWATSPENMYELVLNHRKFLLLFSFVMNLLILVRFRFAGLGFILFYEFSKFYLFGDRFLAEGFIVYPLVYMSGLVWYKFKKIALTYYDYILTACFAWFVIFMREPYIPVTIILFAMIVFGKPFSLAKKICLGLFALLTIAILSITPLQDYYFNVITINQQTILSYEAGKGGLGFFSIVKMFFYPFFMFWGGEWNIFRHVLIGLTTIYIVLSGYSLANSKRMKFILAIFVILGVANIRIVNQGHVYYDAFHLIPWFGIFVFFTFALLHDFYGIKKHLSYVFIAASIALFLYLLAAPASYIHEKQYPHETFITNYGRELQAGEAIRKLSNPHDTVFVDGFDDLIYWQAKRLSPYRYSWYTSVMPLIETYAHARVTMFEKTPPDFYYGSCPRERNAFRLLPESQQANYIRLAEHGKQSCLFVHTDKMPDITEAQWKMAEELGYTKNQQTNPVETPEESL